MTTKKLKNAALTLETSKKLRPTCPSVVKMISNLIKKEGK